MRFAEALFLNLHTATDGWKPQSQRRVYHVRVILGVETGRLFYRSNTDLGKKKCSSAHHLTALIHGCIFRFFANDHQRGITHLLTGYLFDRPEHI